jgi:4'-phosphopantetheinyl transferase
MLSHYSDFVELLSESELIGAQERHIEIDIQRYVADRALLRIILGYHLNLPPKEVQIEDVDNRPRIAPRHLEDIRFTCSHAFDWTFHTAYAISTNLDVGIHLARIQEPPNVEEIVDSYLSPSDLRKLQLAPSSERARLFTRLWTRNEALSKASGVPLALVAKATGGQQDLPLAVSPARSGWKFGEWSVFDLDVWAGYAAAVAVKGTNANIRHLRVAIPQ